MKILITGATGFIGSALCELITKKIDTQQQCHWTIHARHPQKVSQLKINHQQLRIIENLNELTADDHFDTVINLAGEPIADKRWSDSRKKQLMDSRIHTTQSLIDYFKKAANKPRVFISGSAIGYYGLSKENSDQAIAEDGSSDQSFSSKLCQQWEATALQANELGIRTCIIRTGIVLGNGGALSKMLPPFKMGLGGKMGDGQHWMPWIHLDDMAGIITFCIENDQINGAINATAPNGVSNADFTIQLAKSIKRPSFFTMPSCVIKLLMGQMGEELLLSGKNIVPQKLQQQGYTFKYSNLKEALNAVINA